MTNVSYSPILQQMNSQQSEASDNLPLLYTVLEGIVAIGAFFGNLLVVIVFIQDKRLRKVTNFYIISLAIADLFVGLIGIPSAILTRMGIPRYSFQMCLTMLTLLVVLCTISILNLVAVSLDRYWAILHPLDYHRRISGSSYSHSSTYNSVPFHQLLQTNLYFFNHKQTLLLFDFHY